MSKQEKYLDCEKLRDCDPAKKWLSLGPKTCSYVLSASGKAIQVIGRGTGSHVNTDGFLREVHDIFWIPVSILRIFHDERYGDEVVVPAWFVAKNNLWEQFKQLGY